jgi:hypothetical protein
MIASLQSTGIAESVKAKRPQMIERLGFTEIVIKPCQVHELGTMFIRQLTRSFRETASTEERVVHLPGLALFG